MPFSRKKPEDVFQDALRDARVAKGDESIDRRSKKGRMIDDRGFRRVVLYMTPAEFRELEKLAEAEGATLSVTLRACLRAVRSVKD